MLGASLLAVAGPLQAAPIVERDDAGRVIARYAADDTIGPRFNVPAEWDEIVIGEGVTVTGGFEIADRQKPLLIRGEGRKTSIIRGTGRRSLIESRKSDAWKNAAILVQTAAGVTVRNLTSLEPDKGHIVGPGRSRIVAEDVDLVDERNGTFATGFNGGHRSELRGAFIMTTGDAVKIGAADLVIEDTIIAHRRGGAPFQLGRRTEVGSATLRGVTIIAGSASGYGAAIFTRSGTVGDGPYVSRITTERLLLGVPEGMRDPPVFQWGTNTSKVDNFAFEITGLCSGETPFASSRAVLGERTLSGSKVTLLTPDCPE